MSKKIGKYRVYISGPITSIGYEEAKEKFRIAEKFLSEKFRQTIIINPMKNEVTPEDKTWEEFMREDIKILADCDVLALLPGWKKSKGALLEKHIADQLGMTIIDAETGIPLVETVETVTEEAQRIVVGARRDSYGHPSQDFQRIANLWTSLLADNLSAPITARQVAHLMICVKLSRECNVPKRDNMVDIAGYALAGDMAAPTNE